MKEGTIITSLDELKGLFTGQHESDTAVCSIIIGSCGKSWKNIAYLGNGQWFVFNDIDESEEEFATDNDLLNSIIGEAMSKNALIFEWF